MNDMFTCLITCMSYCALFPCSCRKTEAFKICQFGECRQYTTSSLKSIPTKSHSLGVILTPVCSISLPTSAEKCILDLTPGALILKYYTIGGSRKSHSSACSPLGSYGKGSSQSNPTSRRSTLSPGWTLE